MLTFGPIPSRRLGRSLGINNTTPKSCSYSCRYCRVSPTRETEIIPCPFPKTKLANFEGLAYPINRLTERLLLPNKFHGYSGEISSTLIIMRRLIPEFIQDKYLINQSTGSFQACVLFVDIAGFSALANTLMSHDTDGAEILANLISEIFDPLIQSIFEQGGFVSNFAGDAFTAVFPINGDSSEAFVRSLAASWNVQQAMSASVGHQTSLGEFYLAVKVGLAAGEVFWGTITSKKKDRAIYYFRGSAINGSANAEKLAQPGEIIVDPTVNLILGSMITAEPKDDHFLVIRINRPLPAAQSIKLSPVDTEVMEYFFPLDAIKQALVGEFRQVVSMFIGLPPTRTEEQLRIFMQIVFELQERYGGLLNQLGFGDKGANLLLFWGAPIAHENDVARALNFILDLQSRTAIPFHVGISYRIAHAGYSGGTLAGDYTCHGRGNTLAARLMQASPRGEIWLDERIAERAKHHFEIAYEEDMDIKGFTDKQKVFVLLEHKQEEKFFYTGEMFGRERERSRLREFVEPLWREKFAGTLLVQGEPGIGKSRLITSFSEDLKEIKNNTFSTLLCQTDEILRESLNPFRYGLRNYFGQREQQSEARNKRSFNHKLSHLISSIYDKTLAEELEHKRSFLGALINLSWPDSLYEQLDAQGRYENSFIGLLSLLLAESLNQPLILILEDAHWLDGDSLDFLARLGKALTQNPAYPIAVIITARPEDATADLGNFIDYQEIDLGQVSKNDISMLATNQLGSPIGSGLLDLLVERAEGNPFFAEQILRYLQEQGLLEFVDGHWQLQRAGKTSVPASVNAVMVARLDQLAPDVKNVVQAASVLGREFETTLLVTMLKDDRDLNEKITEAERASIWSAVTELRYLFKHALLRDAAYQMQIRSRRELLHRLAVEALETVFMDNLHLRYGELAYHAEKANLTEKAKKYLLLAAEESEAAFQNLTAIDYYSRALDLIPQEEAEARFQILQSRQRLFRSQGAQKKLEQDLGEMEKLASLLEDINKQATVLVRWAWTHCRRGEYSEALEAALQAVTLVDKEKDTKLFIDAQTVRLWALLSQGNPEDAQEHATALLPMVRKLTTSYDGGDLLTVLSDISVAKGDYFKAREYQEEHLSMARKAGNLRNQQIALSNLCAPCMMLGDYDAAREAADKSLALALECGDLVSIGSVYVNKSWVAIAQCDFESAVDWGKKGIAISRELGVMSAEAEGLIWLGNAYLALDQPDRASAAYHKALKMRRESKQDIFAMDALAGIAQVTLVRNDIRAAGDYVAQIMDYLECGGFLWEPLRIKLTCFRVLQLTEDARMEEFLETMYRELQQQAEKIPDEGARRRFLENVPWNREIIAAKHKFAPG